MRGVAILLVLFVHFTGLAPLSPAKAVFKGISAFGAHGVDLFFVLSGFLITGILLDSRSDSHFFRNFYARRTLRIFPLYYVILAISFLVLPRFIGYFPQYAGKLARLSTFSNAWPWYVVYCSNYVAAWNNAWRHGVLDVTWSLAIEEQYYLAWAVCVYLLSKRRLVQVCGVYILILPFLRLALLSLGAGPLQVYVLTPTRLDGVLWGSLLAIAVRDDGWLPRFLARFIKPAGLICALSVAFVVVQGKWDVFGTSELVFGYSAVALAFASLLWLTYRNAGILRRIFSLGFLRFFGVYSYSIYLFHKPVLSVLRNSVFGERRFRSLFCSSFEGQLLFYCVATSATIPFSLLSWYCLEQPFLRLKKRFAAPASPLQASATAQ
jgi:peptidoglycan/LPS O-acetylase OafA/YrhL